MYKSLVDTKDPWNSFLIRCFSFAILFSGLLIWGFEYRFIHSCATTTGIVSSKPVEFHDHFGHHLPVDWYSFVYKFSVNGRDYSGHGDMDYDPGKTVTVYYTRANPSKNTVEEPHTQWGRNITTLGSLFSFCSFPWRWLSKWIRKQN